MSSEHPKPHTEEWYQQLNQYEWVFKRHLNDPRPPKTMLLGDMIKDWWLKRNAEDLREVDDGE